MVAINFALAASVLAGSALAAPGIFAVNCYNGLDGIRSAFAFYSNNATSLRAGNQPDDIAVVNSTGLIQWEAHRITGVFRGRPSFDFTTYVDSEAQQADSDTFQGIGYASQSFSNGGSLWNVYHDTFGVILYNDTAGHPCVRVYKAFPTTPGGIISERPDGQ